MSSSLKTDSDLVCFICFDGFVGFESEVRFETEAEVDGSNVERFDVFSTRNDSDVEDVTDDGDASFVESDGEQFSADWRRSDGIGRDVVGSDGKELPMEGDPDGFHRIVSMNSVFAQDCWSVTWT